MGTETFTYSRWRHGGWYVHNVRYPGGAVGCVSRNYPDKKWRIVCDPRRMAHSMHVYKSRDEAARAEMKVAADVASGILCKKCGDYFRSNDNYCGLCGNDLREQRGGNR